MKSSSIFVMYQSILSLTILPPPGQALGNFLNVQIPHPFGTKKVQNLCPWGKKIMIKLQPWGKYFHKFKDWNNKKLRQKLWKTVNC